MYTLTLPVRRGVLGDLSSPPAKCAREPQLQETAARVALIGAENAPYGTVSRDTAWSTASISVTARLRRSAVALSVTMFNSPVKASIIVTIAFVIRSTPCHS